MMHDLAVAMDARESSRRRATGSLSCRGLLRVCLVSNTLGLACGFLHNAPLQRGALHRASLRTGSAISSGGPSLGRGKGHLGLRMQQQPGKEGGGSSAAKGRGTQNIRRSKLAIFREHTGLSWSRNDGGTMYNWQNELIIVSSAALLGMITGVAVAGFKTSIKAFREFTYEGAYSDLVHDISTKVFEATMPILALTGIPPPTTYNPEYILFPLLGGTIVSVIFFLEGNSLGPGVKGIVKEIDDDEDINLRKFAAKATGAVATLGSGLSLGPEGPSVELGAGLSRVISEAISFPKDVSHVMISAGCAAGVSAGFAAPLAAIVFALEIVQPSVVQAGDSPSVVRAAAPSVFIASVTSFLFSTRILGGGETFSIKQDIISILQRDPLIELPVFFGLGITCGLLSRAFRLSIDFSNKFYQGEIEPFKFMKQIPRSAHPFLGALVTGIVAAQVPRILFFGYETLSLILEDQTGSMGSPSSLIGLCFAKMALTANAVGSGLVGGIFAPSLFLGATMGDAYSQIIAQTTGISVAGGPTYATIGAASVLAATFRAPITAVILLFELTRQYDVMVPLIASCGMATLAIDILEPNDASPTWAWWWNVAAPPVVGNEREEELRTMVMEQVERCGGNTILAESLLGQMFFSLKGGGSVGINVLRLLLVEMTPPGTVYGTTKQDKLLGVLSNMYLGGDGSGRLMLKEEAERALEACCGIMSSLSITEEERVKKKEAGEAPVVVISGSADRLDPDCEGTVR